MIYRLQWEPGRARWVLWSRDGIKRIAAGDAGHVVERAIRLGALVLELVDHEGQLMMTIAARTRPVMPDLAPWEDVPVDLVHREQAPVG